MGRYDDITPDELRSQLVRYARLVLRREQDGTLLDSVPGLMQFLGELRQMVFAYEVRGARRIDSGSDSGETGSPPDASLGESLRVVGEALERAKELQDELERGLLADDSEEA
jgi:hypothetical protein